MIWEPVEWWGCLAGPSKGHGHPYVHSVSHTPSSGSVLDSHGKWSSEHLLTWLVRVEGCWANDFAKCYKAVWFKHNTQSFWLTKHKSPTISQYHFHFWDERRNEFFANNSSLLSWMHNLETKRCFQMTAQCLLALLLQAVPLLGGPPNLLLMAVDNLGWDDVSWHNPSIIMPNLGTLARFVRSNIL